MAGVVPSTLHQKLKFVIDGQLIFIAAEENMIVAISSGAPFVEVDEKVMESSFKSLEFVNAMYVGKESKIPMPRLSKATQSCFKQVIGK